MGCDVTHGEPWAGRVHEVTVRMQLVHAS
jgi:hypothetical protein